MRNNKLILTFLILISLLLSACTTDDHSAPPSQPEVSVETPSKIVLPTTDPAGYDIVVPEKIEKIVSLAPSITEILVEMGYADKLVAVDIQSKNIENLPEGLEYFELMSPDAERLAAMKPDIIYASTISIGDGADVLSPLKELGISVAYIPSSDSIEGIYKDIEFIAATLQDQAEGDKIVGEMRTRIEETRSLSETITDKKTVYFEISAAPYMYSFGKGVFLNEMIEIIGAENLLADQEGWISVSEELILSKNPQVILTNVNYIENSVEEIKARAGWDSVEAVKNGEIYYIDNMSSSLPNHNIVKALEEMLRAVYPELN